MFFFEIFHDSMFFIGCGTRSRCVIIDVLVLCLLFLLLFRCRPRLSVMGFFFFLKLLLSCVLAAPAVCPAVICCFWCCGRYDGCCSCRGRILHTQFEQKRRLHRHGVMSSWWRFLPPAWFTALASAVHRAAVVDNNQALDFHLTRPSTPHVRRLGRATWFPAVFLGKPHRFSSCQGIDECNNNFGDRVRSSSSLSRPPRDQRCHADSLASAEKSSDVVTTVWHDSLAEAQATPHDRFTVAPTQREDDLSTHSS